MALSKLTDIRKSLSVEVEDLQVNGIGTFSGNVSIGGTLTYEDVTNIDSVGLITAKSGINVTGGILNITNSENTLGILSSTDSGANIDLFDDDTQTRIRTVDGKLNLYADMGNSVSDSAIRIFVDGANEANEKFRIDSSGRVLIGLTTSSTTDSNAHSKLQVASSAGPNIGFCNNSSDIDDDDRLGVINFSSNHGGTYHEVATIRAAADADHASNSKASRLELYTTATGNTQATERLRITSTGLVGIGTDDPAAKLEVLAQGNTQGGIFITDSNTSQPAPYLRVLGKRSDGNTHQNFSGRVLLASLRTNDKVGSGKKVGTIMFGGNHTDASESNILYAASIAGVAGDSFDSATDMPTDLAFYTGSTGRTPEVSNVSSGEERLRITSDGKIGINDTAPERTVDVKGSNCMVQLEGTGGSGKQWSLCSADNTTGASVGSAGMFAIYNDTDGVAALRVSNSNYVLRPKLPYFYATATPTVGSNYIHSFGNVHGNNGSHYNNSNGRFTAPVSGFYWFACGIWCNSSSNTTSVLIQLQRYNNSLGASTAFAGANHRTQYNSLNCSGGTYMDANDYVWIQHQGGLTIQGSTPRNYFSGYLVG